MPSVFVKGKGKFAYVMSSSGINCKTFWRMSVLQHVLVRVSVNEWDSVCVCVCALFVFFKGNIIQLANSCADAVWFDFKCHFYSSHNRLGIIKCLHIISSDRVSIFETLPGKHLYTHEETMLYF